LIRESEEEHAATIAKAHEELEKATEKAKKK
jgi:hypothetical protein